MRKALLLGVIFILISGCAINNEESNHYNWTEQQLIAHAGGAIDGYTYTNSKEALINSYNNGYRLFELDFSITSDSNLVVRHGWEEDYGQNLSSKTITYEQFMNSPYYNKYSPLDFDGVIALLEEYPDIYIIMDGKTTSVADTKKLYEKINSFTKDLDSDIKNRLIPQMFYKDDLELIRQYGFHDMVYVVGREDYTPETLADFCDKNDIRVVSLSESRAELEVIKALNEKSIKSYVYTINDLEVMKEYFQLSINGIFTDFILPQEIVSIQ
ncbi:glycerophosphodiester phosphodiesterase family protein [Paucisalibacillus globulus]|uniref:glycerophosphodiester phosphodiesterase family protein n=1 Tax=Paucisalibacillus globulus TaxID=351095 RepID=UPI00040FBCB3|nr:glycerophosphodiester phosphodiesterase family protein [Paucisalibacillus globulus]